ncbi:MAG: hypothetical protein E2O96_06390, partial [Acidobacteria bacterium]
MHSRRGSGNALRAYRVSTQTAGLRRICGRRASRCQNRPDKRSGAQRADARSPRYRYGQTPDKSRRVPTRVESRRRPDRTRDDRVTARKRRVALVTSNGWGLGHLSRQLAVALALVPGSEVTVFSMSRGLSLIGSFGIRGEYCPGVDSPWIVGAEWDSYVRDRFIAYLEETSPDVVLFDGVAPYLGILRALRWHPEVKAGWLRRGMWQSGPNDGQLRKEAWFDFIIEPGDLAAEADKGPTAGLDAIRIPAISLLDVLEPYSRADACARLGLDPDKRALLITLGSGQPGESSNAAVSAVATALEATEWQVAVARSPIAPSDTGSPREGTIELPGVFPLAQYLAAFDAAIGAAGYNSVHEWLRSGVPSLLVPKSASKTDDQVARARFLSHRGLVLVADDDSPNDVISQTRRLLTDD